MDYKSVCSQIKTPAYVFNAEEFSERASEARSILGPDVKICYSIKANPFLLAMLPKDFSAVEVCSPGELRICMELGIDPSMIIYSGLNKGREDIASAIDYGAGVLTAESLLHLEVIDSEAEKYGSRVRVLARASANSQFGIDRHELPQILTEAAGKYPNIEFIGIHFFTGTQKRKSKEIIKEIDFLKRYISELRETTGLDLPRIEYGTGLPAFMFYDNELSSISDAVSAEFKLLSEISPKLNELAQFADLTIEMGRFFAASCGHYFSEVADVKANDGINYAIIDGGSHQVRYYGQMQGMQVPFMDLIRCTGNDIPASTWTDYPDLSNESSDAGWTICGSLCTTADVLARGAFPGNSIKIGDMIAFHQAGAYSLYECMSMFLSRDLPRIYLMDSAGCLSCARDGIESYIFNRPEGIC